MIWHCREFSIIQLARLDVGTVSVAKTRLVNDELTRRSQPSTTHLRKNVIFLCIVFLLSSCTTLQEISPQNGTVPSSGLKVEDRLSLSTKQGGRVEIEVAEIQTDRIVGKGEQVMIDDIAKMEKKQYSVQKTAALSGLLIGIAISPPVGLALALLSLGM